MNKILLIAPLIFLSLYLLSKNTVPSSSKDFPEDFLTLLKKSEIKISSSQDILYRYQVYLKAKEYINREQPKQKY